MTPSPEVLPRGRLGSAAAGRVVDVGEGIVDRVVEVPPVECFEQAVTRHEVVEAAAQLYEHDVRAAVVELVVETLEHVGCGHVDVGDCLALDNDPTGTGGDDQPTNLLAERAGVRKEEGRLPAENHDIRSLHGVGIDGDAVPESSEATRPSTWPVGHQFRLKNARMESATAIRIPSSTPKNTTPSVAVVASMKADVRTRRNFATVVMSIRDRAAAITIAASAAFGRLASNPGRKAA